MANTRPLWFLDVDGVLNAERPYPKKWNNWNQELLSTKNLFDEPVVLKITWATEVVDYLNDMMDHVDVLWLTSWADTVNDDLVPLLGLKQTLPDAFALAGFQVPRSPSWGEMWDLKKKTVRTLMSGEFLDRPFIWTDDDFDKSSRHAFSYLSDGHTLFIRPHEHPGLVKKDLERITTFVDRYRDGDS